MNETSRMKLQNLLNTLQMEADPIAIQLEECHKEIFRLKQVTQSMTSQFYEDEYVFSPRANRTQGEEINRYKEELARVQAEYDALQKHYNQINDNIDSLVEVLSMDDSNRPNTNGLIYQEQDRQRIARDLHDTALQNMAYFADKLDLCTKYIDKDPIKAKMELSLAKQNLKDSIDDIRSIIYNLRPMLIDVNSFKTSLERLLDRLNEKNEYLIQADIGDVSCNDQLVLTSIYRIIEECFHNIKSHAEAYRINFIFQNQIGHYYIYVEDDGKGFDPNKIELNDALHFGLNIMKERVNLLGGTIYINSSINAGTRIKILIPIA